MDLEQHSWRLLANHGLNHGATLWLDPEGPCTPNLTATDPVWQHSEPVVDAFQMTSSHKQKQNICTGWRVNGGVCFHVNTQKDQMQTRNTFGGKCLF